MHDHGLIARGVQTRDVRERKGEGEAVAAYSRDAERGWWAQEAERDGSAELRRALRRKRDKDDVLACEPRVHRRPYRDRRLRGGATLRCWSRWHLRRARPRLLRSPVELAARMRQQSLPRLASC